MTPRFAAMPGVESPWTGWRGQCSGPRHCPREIADAKTVRTDGTASQQFDRNRPGKLKS